jgi:hypothetical protein
VKSIVLLALVAALYFGFKSDAPTPAKPLQPFAQNKRTGKLEWFLNAYASQSECAFYREQTVRQQNQWYGEPSGCFYQGYQSPYVLWLANAVIDRDSFNCIARIKERAKFEEPVFMVMLRGYSAEPSGNWECAL